MPLIWLVGTSFAMPVLHADGDSGAVERAAEASAIEMTELQPLPLPEALVEGLPWLLGKDSEIEVCEGVPVSPAELEAKVSEARSKALYLDFPTASGLLDETHALLPCLAEPLEAASLAYLGFLRGYVAASEGDQQAAIQGFELALAADPDLEWDPDLPDTGRKLLGDLRGAVRTWGQLELHPGEIPAQLDGTEWDGSLWEVGPGEHLVQVESQAALVSVASGGRGVLVAPELADEDLLGWPGEPERHEALDLVLEEAGLDDGVLVVDSKAVWRGEQGTWTELSSKPALSWKPVARWTGAGLLVGGGALAALSYAQGSAAQQAGAVAVEELDREAYDAAQPDYAAAGTRLLIGDAVAVSGLLLLGASWAF